MSPASLALGCALAAAAAERPAEASVDLDSVLLGVLHIGAVVVDPPDTRAGVRLRVGAGLDWLRMDGLTAQLRLDTHHVIDGTVATLIGWSFGGARRPSGLPLVVTAGPTYSLDRDLNHRLGGRIVMGWALWMSRATLDLDVNFRNTLPFPSNGPLEGAEVVVGLSLRVVPWTPWRL